jgi:hypothetical protein
MEDGSGQLDVAKVTGTSLDILLAGAAGVHAVDGTELGVVETLLTGPLVVLVHSLGVDDVHHTHGLDLLGGEQPELDLLDRPERTLRHCERAGRHGCGEGWVLRVRESPGSVLSVIARGGHAGRFSAY